VGMLPGSFEFQSRTTERSFRSVATIKTDAAIASPNLSSRLSPPPRRFERGATGSASARKTTATSAVHPAPGNRLGFFTDELLVE